MLSFASEAGYDLRSWPPFRRWHLRTESDDMNALHCFLQVHSRTWNQMVWKEAFNSSLLRWYQGWQYECECLEKVESRCRERHFIFQFVQEYDTIHVFRCLFPQWRSYTRGGDQEAPWGPFSNWDQDYGASHHNRRHCRRPRQDDDDDDDDDDASNNNNDTHCQRKSCT